MDSNWWSATTLIREFPCVFQTMYWRFMGIEKIHAGFAGDR